MATHFIWRAAHRDHEGALAAMTLALAGIKIIDLTRVLAGPFATMVLADLGAEVIKIEMPLSGDDARQFPPFQGGESAYFMSINRNKKSITLNLKADEGQAIFLRLLQKCDVLVENFRPGTMEKLGLGYERLKLEQPGLIYAAASGYGQTGPYSQRAAYDAVVQALGGVMSITSSEKDGAPTRVGTSIGDITAGLYTAIGILAAVVERQRSGVGQMVDVAMLDCQVSILENAISRYLTTGIVPRPVGNRHPAIVPFEPFETSDGYLMIAAGNDALWQKFCRAAGLEELAAEAAFATNARRNENYDQLRPRIALAMGQKTTAQWQMILDSAGIPNGPIQSIDQVIRDPQVQAREMIQEIEHPTAGRVSIPGIPIKLSETPGSIRMPAPRLGEHTAEILSGWLGLGPGEVEGLRARGVI
jgi:CoA:oxalate CoA-transferase